MLINCFSMTDFLQAALAEAQVVCVGQLVHIAGDLNADPAVFPCLAKGISAGKFVDLALAFSRGAGTAPVATCRFNLEGGAGTRRDFLVGCPDALAASDACFVTDRWFTPHFLYSRAFALMLGWRMLLALWYVNPSGLPIGWILLIGPPRLLLVLSRYSVDDCWFICSRSAEDGLFHADSRAGGPLRPAALLFLVEVCYVFVAGVWESELLVERVRVGCIGSWGSG